MPQEQWPQIAMVNEVWYKNGERYVHPSFAYAATGFLIDVGWDTLAATVKHALWIAKTSSMTTVDINDDLQHWIMHPKGRLQDSVVIDRLLNNDPSELLQGAGSSITQRDWLVFSIRFVSPHIQPLQPRYTPLRAGEKLWYFGCPYDDPACSVQATEVIETAGDRIVFRKPQGIALGGASGSPLVDADGHLVGILGGFAVARSTGEEALYGISTRYLQKVLSHEQPLNTPLIPMTEVLLSEFRAGRVAAGRRLFEALKAKSENWQVYDFSSESVNAVGNALLEEKRFREAIALYQLSLQELALSPTYTQLGKAYRAIGKQGQAEKALRKALELWPANKEAQAILQELER